MGTGRDRRLAKETGHKLKPHAIGSGNAHDDREQDKGSRHVNVETAFLGTVRSGATFGD